MGQSQHFIFLYDLALKCFPKTLIFHGKSHFPRLQGMMAVALNVSVSSQNILQSDIGVAVSKRSLNEWQPSLAETTSTATATTFLNKVA